MGAGAGGGPGRREYTATPLWRKLGIREGARVRLVRAPDGFDDGLRPLPSGAAILPRARRDLDVVVLFLRSRSELDRAFLPLVPTIRYDGRLWVAWPKRASRVPTDVTFDAVQRAGLDAGLVDTKSAALTEIFQGLQFVYRLEDRPRR
jgi:hypothetical protein